MRILMARQKVSNRAGFSLVETALAMLVAAVGLTAVIALMPAAMDQQKKAADETHAAIFADTVFNSYLAALYSTNVTWAELKNYKTIAPNSISGGQDVMWKDSNKMSVIADDRIHTQLFIAAVGSKGIYDHALRYKLAMEDIVTNGVLTRRRSLSLEVWPGEYGATNNGYRFATELFNHGFR
ncbi:MAG: hypothetical protein M5U15_08590 [Kiritimatiellae bacterium]|nr:hypothetical protein [Kiritimatiellia bacterium]